MPDWQGELEALLATLNVSLEGAPRGKTPEDDAEAALLGQSDIDDAALLDGAQGDGDEVSAVRREIEATVGQVVALVRAGRMDRALPDDVIFVLDALTRPRPKAGPGAKTGSKAGNKSRAGRPSRSRGPDDSATEWNLASAAAILRFCRIVLRLTNAIARDNR
jgi:hypothetical protein